MQKIHWRLLASYQDNELAALVFPDNQTTLKGRSVINRAELLAEMPRAYVNATTYIVPREGLDMIRAVLMQHEIDFEVRDIFDISQLSESSLAHLRIKINQALLTAWLHT